ncbi:MAG: DNA-directed RNA polymerase subunit beta', partial [Leptospiraceae bacterium]|nr:DNA-directed RNA polymerase subunit beta' [Leptospiraceae bacterium]
STRGSINLSRINQVLETGKMIGLKVEDAQVVVPGEVIATGYDGEEKPVTAEAAGTVRISGDSFFIEGEAASIPVRIGTILNVQETQVIEPSASIATFDPYNEVVVSDARGTVNFVDIEEDKNLKKDEEGNYRLIEYRRERLNPRMLVGSEEYSVPPNAIVTARNGQSVQPGDVLYKIAAAAEKTRDITGGLPRVEELFEARRPREASTLAELDGRIEDHNEVVKEKRVFYIVPDNEELDRIKVAIPVSNRLRVRNGDYVKAGDMLDEGMLDPHDILRIKGINALHEFLVHEVQEVYRLQGVFINDKHIEIIVRQMLRKLEVDDPGDTSFVAHQQVDRFSFKDENERVESEGGVPATSRQILLGITRASLNTDSFISAASFQETTRVLTDAAIKGKKDPLLGLKENVIIGHLIPAGTGLKHYRDVEIFYKEYGDIQKLEKERREAEELAAGQAATPESFSG